MNRFAKVFPIKDEDTLKNKRRKKKQQQRILNI